MWSILQALSSLLTIVKSWMEQKKEAELKADAVRKSELESRDKQDEKKKEADKIWDRPDDGPINISNRVRRTKPDSKTKG